MAELWNASESEYHADEACESNGRLSVFRESIPKYHAMFIGKTMAKKKTSAAMQLGSAVHLKLLEPERFSERIAINPEVQRRSNADKATWAEFELANWDKVQIDQADLLTIDRMVAAVRSEPEAARWLDMPGRSEQSIRWTHDNTGVRLRCRCDKLLDDGTILEIKTAENPTPESFAKAVVDWGYHCQSALYMAGVKELVGEARHVMIVVGSKPPHDCGVYRLDDEALALGEALNRSAIWALRDCRELDVWRNPWYGKMTTIALPRWAFNRGVTL